MVASSLCPMTTPASNEELFAEFRKKVEEILLGEDLTDAEFWRAVRKASFEVEIRLAQD